MGVEPRCPIGRWEAFASEREFPVIAAKYLARIHLPTPSFYWNVYPGMGCALYSILLFVTNSFFNISTMGVPNVNILATFILFYLQRYFVFGLNAGCEGVLDSPCCWKLSTVCSASPHPPGPARPPTAPSAPEPRMSGGRLSLGLLKRAEWI